MTQPQPSKISGKALLAVAVLVYVVLVLIVKGVTYVTQGDAPERPANPVLYPHLNLHCQQGNSSDPKKCYTYLPY